MVAAQLGLSPHTMHDQADGYVAKLAPNGDHIWSKAIGGYFDQEVIAMATDSAGGIVIAGGYQGSPDLGGGSFPYAQRISLFIAKLDADGNHVWSKGFPTAAARASAIVMDGDAPVLAGSLYGTVDFGGGALTNVGAEDILSGPGADIFMVKLDAGGNHLWSKRFGGARHQQVVGMARDGAGNLLLTGYFESTVDFGGGPLTSAADGDVFLAKLDAGGDHVWSKRFGGIGYQDAGAIALDGAGGIVLSGQLWGSIDFGTGPNVSAGNNDLFVARLLP